MMHQSSKGYYWKVILLLTLPIIPFNFFFFKLKYIFWGNNWSYLSNPFHIGMTYNILGTRLNGMKRGQLLLHPSSLYTKRIALLGSISSLHRTSSVYVFTTQNGPWELFSRQMGCLDGLKLFTMQTGPCALIFITWVGFMTFPLYIKQAVHFVPWLSMRLYYRETYIFWRWHC